MREIRMSKAEQSAISKYFSTSGNWYQPGLAIALGSTSAGILLSQLLYWHGKGKRKPWTYKTIEDMKVETGLTRNQQDTAIRILKNYEIIEVKKMGVPGTRHFKVNLERLHAVLPSLKKTSKLNYPNPPNYYVENGETITKITRKTTSKTAVAVNRNNFYLKRQELIKSKSARGP